MAKLVQFGLLASFGWQLVNKCRTEYFPVAINSLNFEDNLWNTFVLDEQTSDTLYLAGYIGIQPLLAKYEVGNMRFAWMHGFQTESDEMTEVKNLAITEENNMLAALAQTSKDFETMVLILDRDSGAPVVPSYKLTAPTDQIIYPIAYNMINWSASNVLWAMTGVERGLTNKQARTDKSLVMKLVIDGDSIQLEKLWRVHKNLALG
jgi:hypothetical protein